MSAQALVIDGPLKGQLVDTAKLPLVYEETTGITGDGATSSTRPPVRSYWSHTWTFLGRGINVLSIHSDPAEISFEILWGMIIADDAKQAAIW